MKLALLFNAVQCVLGRPASSWHRFDTIQKQFKSSWHRFDTIQKQFKSSWHRFDTIQKRFNSSWHRFDTIQRRLASTWHRLETLRKRFASSTQVHPCVNKAHRLGPKCSSHSFAIYCHFFFFSSFVPGLSSDV